MVADAVDATTAGPASSSSSSAPVRKGPSKRKRPPTDVATVPGIVFGRSLSPGLLSSSIYDDTAKPEDDFIGGILSKMSSVFGGGSMADAMRSSAIMNDRVKHHAFNMAKAAHEMDERNRGSYGKEVWRCKGCGTEDRSVLELNAERSFVNCSRCGAADGSASAVSNPFEKTLSYQRVEDEDKRDVASLVLNTRDARERRLVRQSAVSGSCVGRASSSSSIARAHASVARGGSSHSSSHGEAALSAHQRTKRDSVVVEIHDLVRKAGRNPDTCPIFKQASNIASNIFVKACCHASVCKTRPPNCPGVICERVPKYIAREAVCRVMQEATTDVTLGGSSQVLSSEDIQNAKNSLMPLLASYTNKVSLRNVIAAEFKSAKDATADSVGNECVMATGESLQQTTNESQMPTGANAEGASSADWRKKLSESFDALRDMSLINRDCHRESLKTTTSFEHREWLNKVAHLPPDLVSLIICTRVAGATSTSNIRTMLNELARRNGLSTESLRSLTCEVVVH